MAETREYAAQRIIGTVELTRTADRPSQALRRAEADLVASLARTVALDDRQFAGWPTFTLVPRDDQPFSPYWLLRAEVKA